MKSEHQTDAESRLARGSESFIEIEDLVVRYSPESLALDGLSLSVDEGEFVCICGPSGCGKSTLMNVLSRLLPPTSGTVTIAGHDVYGTQGEVPVRVGYVFQDHRLLPWRTVRDNLEITLTSAGIGKDVWDERIHGVLEMLQIEEFADAWPLRLSGGQRQRAAIARALVIEPDFMLMDEPYSTLDEVTGRTLRRELLDIWSETGKTIVFVTHSIREAVYLGDRVVLLTPGPGRLLDSFDITVERPRDYEGVELTRVEQRVIDVAVSGWGLER